MNLTKSIFSHQHDKTISEEKWKTVSRIVLVLYCIMHLVMMIFHEPWYDEAEAWQIARCNSIFDILFTVPHYEGHPPLWHLLLMIPAKAGLPYELSLSLVSLTFSATAVALFLKYAPFNTWIKVFAPFTYFAFYQYGVISRPYCMTMLAMVLISITWKSKDENPWRFVLSMAFLCFTTSYGIIIAGGISIIWLLQIISEKKSRFLKDSRAMALIALLVLALLLIAEVMPSHDTSATAGDSFTLVETLYNLLYTFVMMIPESAITRVIQYDQGIGYVSSYGFTAMSSAVILGVVIWGLILYYGKSKKTLLWFVVPYALFASFSSIVYFYAHHIGIGLLVFMFWAWITVQSDVEMPDTEIKQAAAIISKFLIVLALVVCCFWTISSFALDVRYDYYPSRGVASFIKENNLDDFKIMTSWRKELDNDGEIDVLDTNFVGAAVGIFPYFEHNIFYNAHDGLDQLAYDTHKRATNEENAANLKNWKNEGYPDVLVNAAKPSDVFENDENLPEYTLVFEQPYSMVWKGTVDMYASTVYVREELREELGLPEVEKNLEYYIHVR